MIPLSKLIPQDAVVVTGNMRTLVSRIAFDSRKVTPGTLFAALNGSNFDGNNYIADAIKAGAIAILTEKDITNPNVPIIRVPNARKALSFLAKIFYDDPSARLQLAGITGTKGKTTTTYMMQSILRQKFDQAFRLGTVEYDLGFTKRPAKNTTPESLDLVEILHEISRKGIKAGVMEVSSHALKTWRVEDITFAAVGFTNLSLEHTEFHPNMEDYYQAKRRLFIELLPPDGTAVININDEFGKRLHKDCLKAGKKISTIALEDADADLFTSDLKLNGTCSEFILSQQGEKFSLKLSLPGKFNVMNALMAAALSRCLEIEWRQIITGLERIKTVPGRFESIANSRDITVIVDYAHSPAALENVLITARPLTQGKMITVFGCGGNRSQEKRPVMGKISVALSDITIVTSDNPRKEKPEEIISQIMAGINSLNHDPNKKIFSEADRRKAIVMALSMAKKGDLVIIAGKGHETGQTFSDHTLPFDDREVAREILEGNEHA